MGDFEHIKREFPVAPETAKDHAKLHKMIHEADSGIIHLYGNCFLSVIYPETNDAPFEIVVFEIKGDGPVYTEIKERE